MPPGTLQCPGEASRQERTRRGGSLWRRGHTAPQALLWRLCGVLTECFSFCPPCRYFPCALSSSCRSLPSHSFQNRQRPHLSRLFTSSWQWLLEPCHRPAASSPRIGSSLFFFLVFCCSLALSVVFLCFAILSPFVFVLFLACVLVLLVSIVCLSCGLLLFFSFLS